MAYGRPTVTGAKFRAGAGSQGLENMIQAGDGNAHPWFTRTSFTRRPDWRGSRVTRCSTCGLRARHSSTGAERRSAWRIAQRWWGISLQMSKPSRPTQCFGFGLATTFEDVDVATERMAEVLARLW